MATPSSTQHNLSLQELAEFALACRENARRLLDDAELLYENSRFQTALALATLAAEELGKFVKAVSFGLAEGSEKHWREFRKDLASHKSKLLGSMALVWIGAADGEPVDQLRQVLTHARTYGSRKMSAIYVDLGSDGGLSVPSDRIDPKDATEMLAEVLALLTVFDELFPQHTTADGLADQIRSVRTEV